MRSPEPTPNRRRHCLPWNISCSLRAWPVTRLSPAVNLQNNAATRGESFVIENNEL